MTGFRFVTTGLGLVLLTVFARDAGAAESESEQPNTIDTVRGTIQGSTRFIGLGGAFVAIAEDTEGVPINPASAAVRLPYSWDAFSYGFGIDFSVGTWLPENDIYNAPENPDVEQNGTLFGSLAALINYRHAGFGLSAEAEQNNVSQRAQGVSSDRTGNFGLVHLDAAYGYFEGQLLLGAGLRVVGVSFDGNDGGSLLTAGVGYTAGFIVKPTGAHFRFGIAIEQPINAELERGGNAEPTTVHIPWTAAAGLAIQLGSRDLNRPFVTVGDRARRNTRGREPTDEDEEQAAQELFNEYQKDQTWSLLLTTELAVLQGPRDVPFGDDDVPIDRPLFSPRVGLETDVVPRWVRLRGGSYLELPVTEGGGPRLHGTVGGDIKLFPFSVFGLVEPFNWWKFSFAADGAKNYLNTAFSIGIWH
ncbi:MAG TPA: hypothetical protein VFU02_06000 [Polyangiaceae bacterium]|nr:hypothetical protein [Polyangiaceae bacterium]